MHHKLALSSLCSLKDVFKLWLLLPLPPKCWILGRHCHAGLCRDMLVYAGVCRGWTQNLRHARQALHQLGQSSASPLHSFYWCFWRSHLLNTNPLRLWAVDVYLPTELYQVPWALCKAPWCAFLQDNISSNAPNALGSTCSCPCRASLSQGADLVSDSGSLQSSQASLSCLFVPYGILT